ncbi:hypothetical protein BDD12DRAFT_704325, partial [Trichophaea hybrida]
TIVPLISELDERQLTDFSSDKRVLPIYLTIETIHCPIQRKYSYLTQTLFAFILV